MHPPGELTNQRRYRSLVVRNPGFTVRHPPRQRDCRAKVSEFPVFSLALRFLTVFVKLSTGFKLCFSAALPVCNPPRTDTEQSPKRPPTTNP